MDFNSKLLLDVNAGGSLMRKTPEVAFELIKLMAENNYQWYPKQSTPQRLSSMRDDEITILSRQVAMLNERMDFLSAQASQIPEEKGCSLEVVMTQFVSKMLTMVDQTTTTLEEHAATIRRLEEKVDKLVDIQEASFRKAAIKDDSREIEDYQEFIPPELYVPPKPYVPPIPFHQRLQKSAELPTYLNCF